MRLFDRLRTQLSEDDLPAMPVIVADAIARQIDELPTEPGEVYPAESYGVVAPPFDNFYVESITFVDGIRVERGAKVISSQEEQYVRRFSDTAKWMVSVFPDLVVGGQYINLYGVPLVPIAEDGTIACRMEQIQVAFAKSMTDTLPEGEMRKHALQATEFLPIVLKAVSAMHKRVEAEHIVPTRQQRRQHERKHGEGKPLTDYWMLKVDGGRPLRTINDVGVAATRRHFTPREHEVRGHFRYYSDERPLFGRVTGMIWVPAHKRGSDAIGTIRKDYEVK